MVQQVAAAALQKAGRNAGLLNALLECGVNQSGKDPARQTPSACYYCLMCVSSSDLLLIVGRMRAPRAHYTESYLHFMAPLSLLRERYQGNKGRRVVFFSESSFIWDAVLYETSQTNNQGWLHKWEGLFKQNSLCLFDRHTHIPFSLLRSCTRCW